jgi:hypothetical protein
MIERKVVTTGREALEKRAGAELARAGDELERAYAALPAGQRVALKPVVNALEKAKQGFIVEGVVVDKIAVKNLDEMKSLVERFGPTLSPQSLRSVRQILDRSVAQGKGFFGRTLKEGSLLNTQKEAANAIRRELNQASPDIARINAEYSFWSKVDEVISATNERMRGQSGGLIPAIAGSGGFAGGAAVGGVPGGLAGGAAFYAMTRAIRHPLWNTVSPQVKNRLANAIANADWELVSRIAGRVGAATVSRKPLKENGE